MVKAAQDAENLFVGVRCGIMDMYASYLGRAGNALLIDCRSLACRLAPLPEELKVVVCDTGVARTLAGSAYNERRAECEEGRGEQDSADRHLFPAQPVGEKAA